MKEPLQTLILRLLMVLIVFSSMVFKSVFSAPILIKGVIIADVVNEAMLQNQDICIENGEIKQIASGISACGSNPILIENQNLVAIPGFVNTHTHLWQHLARSFASTGFLQEWISGVYPYAHYLTEQEVYDLTLAAAAQALLHGITTVNDFTSANFSEYVLDKTIQALKEAKVGGGVVWWNPAAFLPPELRESEISRLKTVGSDKISLWMGFGPLSFYSLPAVYDGIQIAQKLSLPMTEHTMENVQEERDLQNRITSYLNTWRTELQPADIVELEKITTHRIPSAVDGIEELYRYARILLDNDQMLECPQAGKPCLTDTEKAWLRTDDFNKTLVSPVPLLGYLGALEPINSIPFVSVHSVWQTPNDRALYKSKNVSISYNPESNRYLSSGIARIVDYLLRKELTISIGTDGAASNDRIDFFTAMRSFANLQKIHHLNSYITKDIGVWRVLQAATLQGAEALGLENEIGSITVGKEADLVLLSLDRLGMAPYVPGKNDVAILVYSAGVRDVKHVIADGKIVVEDSQLKEPLSEQELARSLSQIANAVVARKNVGKTWDTGYSIGTNQPEFYYRSVRKKDKIAVSMTNQTQQNISVQVAISGGTFGGAVFEFLHQEVKARFPDNNPTNFYNQQFCLNQGQTVTVAKSKGGSTYTITSPDGSQTQKYVAGQLLLLANPPTQEACSSPQLTLACSCTASGCGNNAVGGDQGDIFSNLTEQTVNNSFKTNAHTGWTCVEPAKVRGSGGPKACYCANYCGNGGIGADPNYFDLGLSQTQVNQYYGGGTPNNRTGWLCGNYRGTYSP